MWRCKSGGWGSSAAHSILFIMKQYDDVDFVGHNVFGCNCRLDSPAVLILLHQNVAPPRQPSKLFFTNQWPYLPWLSLTFCKTLSLLATVIVVSWHRISWRRNRAPPDTHRHSQQCCTDRLLAWRYFVCMLELVFPSGVDKSTRGRRKRSWWQCRSYHGTGPEWVTEQNSIMINLRGYLILI